MASWASDAIPGLARPGYATPGNPIVPSVTAVDITVTISVTRSRAQVTAALVTQADGKTIGLVQGDGKTIGATAGDGKTTGPTTVDRRR